VADTAPVQFVAPMLTTSGPGRLIGSMSTSGSRAREKWARCASLSSEVTRIKPAGPDRMTRSAQVTPGVLTEVRLMETSMPASAAACMTPRLISML
jgi:hypothetical protein